MGSRPLPSCLLQFTGSLGPLFMARGGGGGGEDVWPASADGVAELPLKVAGKPEGRGATPCSGAPPSESGGCC